MGILCPEILTWNQNDPNLLQHFSRYWVTIQIVIPNLELNVELTSKQAYHKFWRRKLKLLYMYHTRQIYTAQNTAIIFASFIV